MGTINLAPQAIAHSAGRKCLGTRLGNQGLKTEAHLINILIPVGHDQETPIVQNDTVHLLESHKENRDKPSPQSGDSIISFNQLNQVSFILILYIKSTIQLNRFCHHLFISQINSNQ